MNGLEHRCQRSDDAENAFTNLLALGRWSGERGRQYPISDRIKALRLLGRITEAKALEAWAALAIPLQRTEDALAQRRAAADRARAKQKQEGRT